MAEGSTMTVIISSTACTCVNWESNINFANTVRQCPEHFRLWRGSTRLTSVGRIVAHSFPLDASIPPDKLENARDRGAEVDKLVTAYVRGDLRCIPAGTRNDARDLFLKFMGWLDKQRFKKREAQVLLGGEDYGGVLDLRLDGVPFELKCTYNVEASHRLQAAGYSALDGNLGQIVHVTERFTTPRIVELEQQDMDDWGISLEHWRMIQRRKPSKEQDETDY